LTVFVWGLDLPALRPAALSFGAASVTEIGAIDGNTVFLPSLAAVALPPSVRRSAERSSDVLEFEDSGKERLMAERASSSISQPVSGTPTRAVRPSHIAVAHLVAGFLTVRRGNDLKRPEARPEVPPYQDSILR
jgi:hypothetical protein